MSNSAIAQSVGIIGCGAVVQEYYTVVLPKICAVRIHAVADLNPENARIVASVTGGAVLSAKELVQCCNWVLITTPPEAHAELAAEALTAGANVVVEKPFVTSSFEARRLAELAKHLGRVLHVAQFRRFFPPTELARQLLQTGIIGSIQRLEMFEGARFNWSTQSGYVGRSRFGGVLFDTGAHTVDQCLYAAGWDAIEPRIIVESVLRDKTEPSHEIDCRFILEGAHQSIFCRLFMSRVQTLANVIRVIGSHGELEFDCSYQGGVRIRIQGDLIRLAPQHTMASPTEAFLAEYHEIFAKPGNARTAAHRMIGQMTILEALHRHE